MKNRLIGLLLLLVVISCGKKDQNDKLIDEFFANNLKDPDSFDLIEKTKDSIHITDITSDIMIYDMSWWRLNRSVTDTRKKLSLNKDKDSIIAVTYKVKYRAKNSFGGYGIESKSFVFTKSGFLIGDCTDFIDCNHIIYDNLIKDDIDRIVGIE